jgi:putative ATPase
VSQSLFGAAAEERLKSRAPLAERMRPQRLDDIIGQQHLLGEKGALRALIESDRLGSIILWGPPGTGKTTLARLVASATKRAFVALSAVTAGVKDVRATTEGARQRLGEHGQGTILFLDEVHRFNKSQQDALLPSVEDGTISLIGATTENPFFEVNAPLLSRSTLFRLEILSNDDLTKVAQRALQHEGASANDDAIAHLVDLSNGDARALLTSLDVAIALASVKPNDKMLTLEDAEQAVQHRVISYGDDEHYDVISAFIKSIRGSDVDAGMYWLARMLAAGEDAKFIARRLVILASEDVGEADPQSLVVATAAAHALEFVGLPEAGLNLAQAVVHLAAAPKSNRVTMALGAAQADVRDMPLGAVPPHLRDGHYKGAAKIGHGVGYDYPHNHPGNWVRQQYLPDELVGRRYYEPSSNGFEDKIRVRVNERREQGPSGPHEELAAEGTRNESTGAKR